jgi:hypothetical protein
MTQQDTNNKDPACRNLYEFLHLSLSTVCIHAVRDGDA